jgi:hypothetical protein
MAEEKMPVPPEGKPIASLGYPPERWQQTMVLGDKWILEGAVPTEMLKDVALEVAAAS